MSDITQPIVVGVDGSVASGDALRYACGQALARQLPMAVVHAWQPFTALSGSMWTLEPPTLSPAEAERASRSVLDRASDLVNELAPSVAHEQYLVQQPAAAALIAASERAQLVVIGGRDRELQEPGWLGPVPLRVAARAECPVVVVPSSPQIEGDVVVGVDGSSVSEEAVAFAFDEASRRNVRLRAVLAYSSTAYEAGLETSAFADVRELAERQLSEGLAGWSDKYPDVPVTKVVTPEAAVRELRKASRTASLVVVGSHGRGVFLRHTLGSVSAALLRVADCPVAVVRPSEESET